MAGTCWPANRSHDCTWVRWWQVRSTRRQKTQIRSRCKPPKKGRLSSHQAAVPCANCGSRRFTSQMYLSMYVWTMGFSPAGSSSSICLEGLPEVVVQPLVVGVAVLHHQARHPLRVPDRQPVADRSTVVLDVEGVLLQPHLLDELLHHVGQLVEGVVELLHGRGRTVAEAGVV